MFAQIPSHTHSRGLQNITGWLASRGHVNSSGAHAYYFMNNSDKKVFDFLDDTTVEGGAPLSAGWQSSVQSGVTRIRNILFDASKNWTGVKIMYVKKE